MTRWTGSLLAAMFVASPFVIHGVQAQDRGSGRATQFRQIQQEYEKAVPAANRALETASTARERTAIYDKLNKEFAPRILKLVAADPKDRLSLEMLTWAVQALPDVDAKVYDLLAEHWSRDAGIRTLCQALMAEAPEAAWPVLRKVLDENPDRIAKGFACLALAKAAADKGDKESTAEAEKLYERTVKEFGGVRVSSSPLTTLGDLARGPLFELRHLQIGMTAPPAEGADVEGNKIRLQDYRGKVTVLDFWATWCRPCRSMIPHERELVKRLKDKPFALVSISADETREALKEFIDQQPMPWAHWWSGPGEGIIRDWNIQGFPTIYVLDRDGVIRYKFVGVHEKEIDEAIEKLLGEVKE